MEDKIITKRSLLSGVCLECESIEEGTLIGKRLLKVLSRSVNGVGLAANQIGINRRVCVINVDKPLVFINPKIVSNFKKISFKESCLSFPGDYVITERYANVLVKSDNHPIMTFGEENLLECVCVQHEIDHLNGITMHDRQIKEE